MGKTFADAATLFAEMTLFAIIKHHAMEKGLVTEQCAKNPSQNALEHSRGLDFFSPKNLQLYHYNAVFVAARKASFLW
jgi:hypothetical protein